MKNYFSENVKYLRKRNKLTQKELGEKLGKAPTAISGWELGTRQPIVRDTIEVCKYFKVDFDDLMYTDLSLHTDNSVFLWKEMSDLFGRLTEEQQSAIISTMKAMVK